MAINRTKNNRRIDVDSHGLRARFAQLKHIYDRNERTPNDSDAVNEALRTYIAVLMNDHERFPNLAGKYQGQGLFATTDSDLLDIVDDEETNWGDSDFPEFVNRFAPLRDFIDPVLNRDGDPDSDTIRVIDAGVGATNRFRDIRRKDHNILTTNSKGLLHNQNVYTFLKQHFSRWLDYDIYERAKLLDIILDALADDSEQVARLAELTSDAIGNDSDLHIEFVENTFRRLDLISREQNELGDSEEGDDLSVALQTLRAQITRVVVDGLLFNQGQRNDSDGDINNDSDGDFGLTFDHRQLDRITNRQAEIFGDSDNLREKFVENLFFRYFDSDWTTVATSRTLDPNFVDSDDNQDDFRLHRLADLWYRYHDAGDSDERYGYLQTQLARAVGNSSNLLLQHASNTVSGLGSDSDLVRRLTEFVIDRVQHLTSDTNVAYDSDYTARFARAVNNALANDSDEVERTVGLVISNLQDDSETSSRLAFTQRRRNRNIRQTRVVNTITSALDFRVLRDVVIPDPVNVEVYVNGVLLSTDFDYSHDSDGFLNDSDVDVRVSILVNGILTSYEDNDNDIDTNNAGDLIDDRRLRIAFEDPLISSDKVTIKYSTVQTPTSFRNH